MPRRPPLALLLVASVVLGASAGLVFPLLPELQKAYHLPTWSLGVMSAATFFTNVTTQLVLGGQADRGRARLMVLGALGLSTVALVWFGFGTTLLAFTGARALSGVAIGMFTPAARAIVAMSDPARVGQRLGRLASADLGGFIAGPVIGVTIVQVTSLKTPFWIFAALVAATLVALAASPFPAAGPLRTRPAGQRTSVDLLRHGSVRVAVLLSVALFLPVGVYDSLWSRYLEDRGASALFTGLSLTGYGIPFVVLAALGGRVADRFGPVRSCLATFWVIVPVVFVYGLLPRPGLIITMAFVDAVFQAIAIPASQAAMVEACPPGRIGAGQGLAGASAQLAAGCTALVAAPVYGRWGAAVVFGGASVTIAVLAVAAAVVNRRSAPRGPRGSGAGRLPAPTRASG